MPESGNPMALGTIVGSRQLEGDGSIEKKRRFRRSCNSGNRYRGLMIEELLLLSND